MNIQSCSSQTNQMDSQYVSHRILVVEDDYATASHIVDALSDHGFTVDHAENGSIGLDLARAGNYSAVVLDRMLPGQDGMAVVTAMRAEKIATPTIFLSALGTVDDRVDGLTAGSNDYLTKPFAMSELIARVEALVRKCVAEKEQASRYAFADLVVDRLTRNAKRSGRDIDLQPREYRLLEYFMQHVDQLVTRKMLLKGVWDYDFDPGTNVIDVHISRLRKKLDDGFDPPLLHTVRGSGYRFGNAD
jgi:two-component system, OmpR family, response regulator